MAHGRLALYRTARLLQRGSLGPAILAPPPGARMSWGRLTREKTGALKRPATGDAREVALSVAVESEGS